MTVAVLRGLLAAAVLVALYYTLPLDRDGDTSTAVRLLLGFVVFSGVMVLQARAVTRSATPGLRAMQTVLLAVPLFIVVVASVYYVLSQDDASAFSEALSKTDALYLTITIFSTVGFGDITPQTDSARLVVSTQMILDLVILGFGARALLTAVQRGRERLATETPEP